MDDRKRLYVNRLNKSAEVLEDLRNRAKNAFDAEFKTWRERTLHSLTEIFGKDHPYTIRFSRLQFAARRIRMAGYADWDADDQRRYENGVHQAVEILEDAYEELAEAGMPTSPAPPRAAQGAPNQAPPQVVLQVMNFISQSTEVNLRQILATVEGLDLDRTQKEEARRLAKELENEARGEQRWEKMAPLLDGLKRLGKAAYERVALPLLLEALKRQMGSGG